MRVDILKVNAADSVVEKMRSPYVLSRPTD